MIRSKRSATSEGIARTAPAVLRIVPLILLLIAPGTAQERTASPVFKSYREPRPGSIVERSDVTYQLWRTFDLTLRAGAGDVLAQQELAVRYLTGRGVKADTARGAFWTGRAAVQNLLPARFNLGILLTNGWGVEWDPFAAYDHFLWCAEHGMAEAQYVVGAFLTEDLVVARNPPDARRWLQASADSGYVPARELLGNIPAPSSPDPAPSGPAGPVLSWSPVFIDFRPDTGMSVTDDVLLREYLKEGMGAEPATSASPARIEDLGPEMRSRLERHAGTGSPEALVLLGRWLERNPGGAKDTVGAAASYVRAVRLDSPRAGELLLELLGDPAAVRLLRTRAVAGDPPALFVLGALAGLRLTHPLHRGGIWITDDEALRMMERSASAGYLPAVVELGLWHFAGRFTAADRARALKLWRDAAALGSVEAAVRRAAAELETDSAAVDILFAGIREGSVLAQVALGYCYELGSGVGRNNAGAARLYRDAARRGSQDAARALFRLHDRLRPPDKRFAIPSG